MSTIEATITNFLPVANECYQYTLETTVPGDVEKRLVTLPNVSYGSVRHRFGALVNTFWPDCQWTIDDIVASSSMGTITWEDVSILHGTARAMSHGLGLYYPDMYHDTEKNEVMWSGEKVQPTATLLEMIRKAMKHSSFLPHLFKEIAPRSPVWRDGKAHYIKLDPSGSSMVQYMDHNLIDILLEELYRALCQALPVYQLQYRFGSLFLTNGSVQVTLGGMEELNKYLCQAHSKIGPASFYNELGQTWVRCKNDELDITARLDLDKLWSSKEYSPADGPGDALLAAEKGKCVLVYRDGEEDLSFALDTKLTVFQLHESLATMEELPADWLSGCSNLSGKRLNQNICLVDYHRGPVSLTGLRLDLSKTMFC